MKRRVILFGGTVILGALGASLAPYPELEIIALVPPLPGARELGALAPDVILFDAGSAQPDSAFALLRARPNLTLIGVDPEGDRITVWSCGQTHAASAEALLRVITHALGRP